MAATTQTSPAQIIDEDKGILRKQCEGLQLKTTATESGVKDIIEGYLATTHTDKGHDQFTKSALENMAATIRNDAESTINAVYPDVEESMVGNVGHNNNPAAEEQLGFGDTRTVPAFKMTDAQVMEINGTGEYGLHITGELMSDSQPNDVEAAIKNAINNGLLHSLSIEYIATDVEFVRQDDTIIRRIKNAKPTGGALTGRPMNEDANLTNRQLKSMAEQNDEMNVKNADLIEQESADDTEENDITTENTTGNTTMTEEEQENQTDEEQTEESTESDGQEAKVAEGLKEDVESLKSDFKSLKEQNEELEEENEELKSKLEDFKTVEDVKSEITDIKSMIEESGAELEDPETTPQTEQEQKRYHEKDEDKASWKRELDHVSNPEEYLKKTSRKGKSNLDMIKSEYGVEEKEVKQYVRA